MIALGSGVQVERMGWGSRGRSNSRRRGSRAEAGEPGRGGEGAEAPGGYNWHWAEPGAGDRVGAPPRPPPLGQTSVLGSRDVLPVRGRAGQGDQQRLYIYIYIYIFFFFFLFFLPRSNLPALHLESQLRRTEREQTGGEGPGSPRGIPWLQGSGLCGRGRRVRIWMFPVLCTGWGVVRRQ